MHKLDAPFKYKVLATDENSSARRGVIQTGHGEIQTPVFMPVGTSGSVKAMTFESVWESGARIILGNTYHLYLRPGHELIKSFGGLHKYQGWDGAILSDSAGYQVFSLSNLNKVTEDGVAFRSHLDGSKHMFTPELSMEIQLALGSDIVMAFDHCLPYGVAESEAAKAVDRTHRWLQRCVKAFGKEGRANENAWQQVLFGIVQGGVYENERRRSAAQLVDLNLPGYAVGGLSVGEPTPAMREMTELTAGLLPADKPRYLMGVGYPDDIVESVSRGIDMFDCVLPTRLARKGTVITRDGRLVVKNSRYQDDSRPIDSECNCPVCKRHSRAYIRHLFHAGEMLGPMLASTHNICFYQQLMQDIRDSLDAGEFSSYASTVRQRWIDGEKHRLEEIANAIPGGRKSINNP